MSTDYKSKKENNEKLKSDIQKNNIKGLLDRISEFNSSTLILKPTLLENLNHLITILKEWQEGKHNYLDFDFIILFFYQVDIFIYKDRITLGQQPEKSIGNLNEVIQQLKKIEIDKLFKNKEIAPDKYLLSKIKAIETTSVNIYNKLIDNNLEEMAGGVYNILDDKFKDIDTTSLDIDFILQQILNIINCLVDRIDQIETENNKDKKVEKYEFREEKKLYEELLTYLNCLEKINILITVPSIIERMTTSNYMLDLFFSIHLLTGYFKKFCLYYSMFICDENKIDNFRKEFGVEIALYEALKIFRPTTIHYLISFLISNLNDNSFTDIPGLNNSSFILPNSKSYRISIVKNKDFVSPALSHEIYEITNGELYEVDTETLFNMCLNLISIAGVKVIKPEEKKKLQIVYMLRAIYNTITGQNLKSIWRKEILTEFNISAGYYSSHSGDFLKLESKHKLTPGEVINKEFKISIDNSIKRWRILSNLKKFVVIDTKAINNILQEINLTGA